MKWGRMGQTRLILNNSEIEWSKMGSAGPSFSKELMREVQSLSQKYMKSSTMSNLKARKSSKIGKIK